MHSWQSNAECTALTVRARVLTDSERCRPYLLQSFLAVFLRGRDEFPGGHRRRRAARLRRGRLRLQLGGNCQTQTARSRCHKVHFLRVVYTLVFHAVLLFWMKPKPTERTKRKIVLPSLKSELREKKKKRETRVLQRVYGSQQCSRLATE